jgi:hypothetical protein
MDIDHFIYAHHTRSIHDVQRIFLKTMATYRYFNEFQQLIILVSSSLNNHKISLDKKKTLFEKVLPLRQSRGACRTPTI